MSTIPESERPPPRRSHHPARADSIPAEVLPAIARQWLIHVGRDERCDLTEHVVDGRAQRR